MEKRAYHLRFDADFLTATRDTGERIRFTRVERSALSTLASRPGRLFSREQLLSAMSCEQRDISDRNVDFIISRLRKKLGDTVRNPRFIATQYGEGYVWVARDKPLSEGGFLVIGPVRGLQHSRRAVIRDAMARLTEQVAIRCAVGQRIEFRPDWSSRDAQKEGAFRFSIEVDLIEDGGRVQGAFALRDETSRRVIRVTRADLSGRELTPSLRQVATALVGAVWRDLALAPALGPDPAGPPLDIRMQNAASTLSRSLGDGWAYIAERLSEEMAATPADPQLAIMQATYLYARMLFGFGAGAGAFQDDETEIERLVLGALPAVRDDVVLRLAAAKLLFVSGAKHLPLVEALVDESMSESTSFASALAMRGTLQAYRGELDAAIGSFNEAMNFCEHPSEFEVFFLVKKSLALIAGGRQSEAVPLMNAILQMKPAERGRIELLWAAPGQPLAGPEAQAALGKISRQAATRLLTYHHRMYARFFSRVDHVRNVMAGPASYLISRFGASVVPKELQPLCLPRPAARHRPRNHGL